MANPSIRSPIGASLTLAELEAEPYAAFARLRAHEPVSWVPVLGGWIVTRRDLCVAVMRDATRFTVDDPHFSTARVVGPSMLSLDGDDLVVPAADSVRQRVDQLERPDDDIDGERAGKLAADLRGTGRREPLD